MAECLTYINTDSTNKIKNNKIFFVDGTNNIYYIMGHY